MGVKMNNTDIDIVEKRWESNPFVDRNWAYALESRKRKQHVNISNFGKNNNVNIIDVNTGELRGTAVTTYRYVDPEKFVKIFADNIGLTFDLTSAGIKAFSVLLFVVQKTIKTDEVLLDKYVLQEFCKAHKKELSNPTFLRGLRELCEAKIIAKSFRKAWYWINPNFVFNGDRISFNTILIRKTNEEMQQMYEQRQLDGIEKLPEPNFVDFEKESA